MERVAGNLEVSLSEDAREIVIRRLDLNPKSDGRAPIVLSPRHARHLASLLLMNAESVEDADAGASFTTICSRVN